MSDDGRSGNKFEQQTRAAIEYAAGMYQRACAQPFQPELMAEAFEELRVALEELQVAEEELRHQNEELAVARQAVEAERQRYQDLFEFAPDGYLVTDTKGLIQEANRAAAQLLNLSQKFLVGKPLVNFVPQLERRAFRSQLARLSQEGSTESWEVELQPRQEAHEASQLFNATLTVAVVRDWNNEPIALRWLLRDTTERKRIEDQVRTLNTELEQRVTERTAELEAANRVKDEFLAIVSHELRSPLNAILGWSQLLRTRKFNQPTMTRALETIERNAKSQTRLIEDLLDISRITQGKVRLNVHPVELAPIVEAVIDTMRPALDAKAIRLQTAFDPLVGPVSGDPDRLQQIFWNLLSNAIKFTPEGGHVEVKIALTHRSG